MVLLRALRDSFGKITVDQNIFNDSCLLAVTVAFVSHIPIASHGLACRNPIKRWPDA